VQYTKLEIAELKKERETMDRRIEAKLQDAHVARSMEWQAINMRLEEADAARLKNWQATNDDVTRILRYLQDVRNAQVSQTLPNIHSNVAHVRDSQMVG
jgi:hypothetical protein